MDMVLNIIVKVINLRNIMGGKPGKHSKKKAADPKDLQMKDDYLKFLRRENLRREKEYQEKISN